MERRKRGTIGQNVGCPRLRRSIVGTTFYPSLAALATGILRFARALCHRLRTPHRSQHYPAVRRDAAQRLIPGRTGSISCCTL